MSDKRFSPSGVKLNTGRGTVPNPPAAAAFRDKDAGGHGSYKKGEGPATDATGQKISPGHTVGNLKGEKALVLGVKDGKVSVSRPGSDKVEQWDLKDVIRL